MLYWVPLLAVNSCQSSQLHRSQCQSRKASGSPPEQPLRDARINSAKTIPTTLGVPLVRLRSEGGLTAGGGGGKQNPEGAARWQAERFR